ncbi:MAG: Phosphoenolpyruvate synthase/pyruvate phosphate dikinase [Desulfotomaculum sp. 46_296]|nr:MAG: Phosphoenolpyruvate synthase/pyruvate phosphate dikinase [Desulfotomaculum sp. 46_296]
MGILGEPVAVRSSATAEDSAQASFAGIHSSFLNVTGWENILKAVKDCYASLWTPRAAAYRRKLGLADQDVLPAVVIMKMGALLRSRVTYFIAPGRIWFPFWRGIGTATDCEPWWRREKQAGGKKEALAPPDVILGKEPIFAEPVVQDSGNYLQGVATAAGKASGIARLIRHPGEGNRLQPGDILVAPSTDPGWTPLFLKACAVVMETGGYLSHGSIVAREFGFPAVVNVPGVMKVIKESQKIIVDGDEGKVFL